MGVFLNHSKLGCQRAIARFLILYVFGPSGFWTMAPLCYAAKFNPFLSLDWAPTPSALGNPRKGIDQILPSGNYDFIVYTISEKYCNSNNTWIIALITSLKLQDRWLSPPPSLVAWGHCQRAASVLEPPFWLHLTAAFRFVSLMIRLRNFSHIYHYL